MVSVVGVFVKHVFVNPQLFNVDVLSCEEIADLFTNERVIRVWARFCFRRFAVRTGPFVAALQEVQDHGPASSLVSGRCSKMS